MSVKQIKKLVGNEVPIELIEMLLVEYNVLEYIETIRKRRGM
ncbi:MAG: hypothetical protein RMH75_06700 [Archaeoglobaceae archaeon]|nr:hypothetical protein [Archaeoglobaceae archaeon]